MRKNKIFEQNGSIEIGILILSSAILIAFTGLAILSDTLNKITSSTIISAQMVRSKIIIEMILKSPSSYKCSSNGGTNNCVLTTSTSSSLPPGAVERIASLMGPIHGQSCHGGNACGLQIVDGPTFTMSSGSTTQSSVKMGIVYISPKGAAYSKSLSINVKIPLEILQNPNFQCDTFLDGFNADGSLKCAKIKFDRAKPGYYISEIDPNTFEVKYSQLPGLISDCSNPNQFAVNYKWEGEDKYSLLCGNRVDPFSIQ